MPAARLYKVQTATEMDSKIDAFLDSGYTILAHEESHAELQRWAKGSTVAHVLLALFTAGIGNLILLAVSYSRRELVKIKLVPKQKKSVDAHVKTAAGALAVAVPAVVKIVKSFKDLK